MIWKQRKQVNVQLNLKVEADLNMTGQYDVKGTGLSMVKVTGGKHHYEKSYCWKLFLCFDSKVMARCLFLWSPFYWLARRSWLSSENMINCRINVCGWTSVKIREDEDGSGKLQLHIKVV